MESKKEKEIMEQQQKKSPLSEEGSNNTIGELHTMEEENVIEEEDALQAKLTHYISLSEELKKSSEENYQQFLRARADLENFRRRSRKEAEDRLKYASLPLIEALLPVLDNFERALQTVEITPERKPLHDGMEMVYRQFQSALTDAGLASIEAKGTAFDPHQHNAVMQEAVENVESGIVLEEMQTGYRFLDRVIRPTAVKVNQ